jgi:hypothetical protein
MVWSDIFSYFFFVERLGFLHWSCLSSTEFFSSECLGKKINTQQAIPVYFVVWWSNVDYLWEGRSVGQICGYKGIEYSSATLASAMSNLTPAFIFILAVIFRFPSFSLNVPWSSVFTSVYFIVACLLCNASLVRNLIIIELIRVWPSLHIRFN